MHGLVFELLTRELGEAFSGDGAGRRIAVVGMGEIGRKAADLLSQRSDWQIVRINRSIPERQQGRWVPLADGLDRLIADVDAVVLATGAPGPVLRGDHVEARRDRPLHVIDIGTPAQVADDVAGGEVRCYGLDDLLSDGPHAWDDTDMGAVLGIVDDAVEEYRLACRKREVAGLLRTTQDRYDRLVYENLPRLLDAALQEGDPPTLDAEARRHLEGDLRNAIRAYTRDIVGAIEETVAGKEPGQPTT